MSLEAKAVQNRLQGMTTSLIEICTSKTKFCQSSNLLILFLQLCHHSLSGKCLVSQYVDYVRSTSSNTFTLGSEYFLGSLINKKVGV